jgi:hypothetical protein
MSIPRMRRARFSPPINVDAVEDADHCRWYKCEHCDHLHVVLLDIDNDPIATAVLSEDMLKHMLAVVNDEVQ